MKRLFWQCHVTLEDNFIRDKLFFKEVNFFVQIINSQILLKPALVFNLTLEISLGLINSIAWMNSIKRCGGGTKCQGAF